MIFKDKKGGSLSVLMYVILVFILCGYALFQFASTTGEINKDMKVVYAPLKAEAQEKKLEIYTKIISEKALEEQEKEQEGFDILKEIEEEFEKLKEEEKELMKDIEYQLSFDGGKITISLTGKVVYSEDQIKVTKSVDYAYSFSSKPL